MKDMPVEAENTGPLLNEEGCRNLEEYPDEIEKISELHGEDGSTRTQLVSKSKGGGDGGSGDDGYLNIEKVFERFDRATKIRLKSSTKKEYRRVFKRFAIEVGLVKYTRRQLMGPKGKNLILSHLETIPVRTRRFVLAYLKSIWTLGMNLPWPIDIKRDIGRLPRTRREQSPPDSTVLAWKEAIGREKDVYIRLIWLLIAQNGWRPSHLAKMKWRNVQHSENGTPTSIIADGAEEGFKTNSPVAVLLSPDVQNALIELMETMEIRPEQPILPWRSCNGIMESSKELGEQSIRKQWQRLQKKWGLPILRPKDMRHWVAGACRKAGLSKQATAYMMGHDPTHGESMRDWYDSPQLDEIFQEQAGCLPNGPLGALEPPKVEIVDGLPSGAIELLRKFIAGDLGTLEFANRIEAYRARPQDRILEP